MANNYWISSASGNWSDSSNWSLSAVPTSDDDVFFTADFNGNMTADIDVNCKSITVQSGYSGNISFDNHTITVQSGASFDGTGTLNLGNGYIQSGNGAFHIGSGVGALTSTLCTVTIGGTSTIDFDKVTTFNRLIISSSANVTNSSGYSGQIFLSTNTPLTIENNATLTINQTMYFRRTTSGDLYSVGSGVTLNGSSSPVFQPAANSISCNFPALTYTGTGILSFYSLSSSTNITINLMGDINSGTATFALRNYSSSGTTTINTNNYNITCGSFRLGSGGAATTNISLGSSVITISAYVGTTAGYDDGNSTIDLGTSQWTVSGNITIGTKTTLTYTVGQLISITATCTLTTQGQHLYDVTNTTGTLTLGDNAYIDGDLIITTGSFTMNGKTLTVGGDFVWNASGTLTANSTLTLSGDGEITISNSGTITTSSCNIVLLGNNVFKVNKSSTTWKSLTGATTGHNTELVGSFTLAAGSATALTLGNGSLTINNTLTLSITSSTIPWNLTEGYSINGTGSWIINLGSGTNSNFAALSTNTTGAFTIRQGAVTTTTVNITGISTGGTLSFINPYAGTLTINLSGSYSCGTLNIGTVAAGTYTLNCGSATISCNSLNNSSNNIGTQTYNLGTSQWTVAGNWTWGDNANTTVNADSSSVTFTNTATITSQGKSFNSISINASGKTITLADNLIIKDGGAWSFVAGILNAATFYIIFDGDATITLGANMTARINTKTSGQTITWNTGENVWTIPQYNENDIGGTTDNLVNWISSNPGTYYNVSFPIGVILSYCALTDIYNNGEIVDASNGTNMNGGHTYGILWPVLQNLIMFKLWPMDGSPNFRFTVQ